MVEIFLMALFALLVALYIQARAAAREVRRNRETSRSAEARLLILKRDG